MSTVSTSVAQAHVSEAEYLAMERASTSKHELWNGEVFAMTGGTLAHAMLSMNIGAMLHTGLRERGCKVLSADAKVHVPLSGGYVYPDVSVVCGTVETHEGSDDVLRNPILVVEVLSESTERFDRGDKFAGYRSIPSLVDYVLVAQAARHVEVYTRQPDASWILRAYDDAHPQVRLPSLELTLALTELFRGVLDEAPASA